MQTIIMTVGTSMLTNRDSNLTEKRPWVGEKSIGDRSLALEWLSQKLGEDENALEWLSAETNTFWRLDPKANDEIMLLHSDTPVGLECATVVRDFLKSALGQENVTLHQLPGVNYETEESKSGLEKMAELLETLINTAHGNVTLAATGGFKAQTMIMGLVGNSLGIPVCYIHEQYRALIYLPYLKVNTSPTKVPSAVANLPDSSKPRPEVIKVQESKKHHRPKVWKKVKKMLEDLLWVEYVRFDENAFSAPKNGVKAARRGTKDGRHVFWLHLYESEDTKMAVSIETTGYTDEQAEQAARELRKRLGRLIS
ncbi:MAG: putative CRISPR-associated protein [Microcoleaceae cyanobacterium]